MNYYDEHATEAGLRLREQFGGTVTLVSVGAERVKEALRTGLAMGADDALLVSDPALAAAAHPRIAPPLAPPIPTLPPHVPLSGKLSTAANPAPARPPLAHDPGL